MNSISLSERGSKRKGMQDYLINQLLVAIAPFLRWHRGTWLRIRRLPVRSLIIVEYLWYSLAVMVQPYLPCDKALLHLWRETKAINQSLANSRQAPPCVFVRLFVCVVKVAEEASLPERYHLPYHTLQSRETQNRPAFKHACLCVCVCETWMCL